MHITATKSAENATSFFNHSRVKGLKNSATNMQPHVNKNAT